MEISYKKYESDSQESQQTMDHHSSEYNSSSYDEYSFNSGESSYDSCSSETDSNGSECSDETKISSNSMSDEQSRIEEEDYWQKYSEDNKLHFSLPNFLQSVGVNNQIKALKDPIEFFQLFFGDGIFEELCDLTDIHYNQKHKSKHKKRDSHHRRWQKPDLSSMKCYFGILLYMGIVQKPTIGHYWRTSQLFGSKGISQLMSEEHWQDINSNLYFIDEEVKSDESDPLYKIQPLIKHIISVSQEYYSPEKNLTIDESMIRFRGRSKFKVYMPLKPIRFGFKAYVLAESSSGYMLNWKLHEGKKSTLKEIVEYLTSPYKERNHIIYMDRFYTTISVIERLHETGFGFYGAIMKRRARIEPKVKSQVDSLEKHKSLFFVSSDRNKILTIWMDSKKVHIISSIGDDSHSEIKRKRDKKAQNQF